jgi:hypothetical protein
LCNLATNPDIDNLGESLEDTLRDMASYCIMTVMELKDDKVVDDVKMDAMCKGDNVSCEDDTIRAGDKFECTHEFCKNNMRFSKGKTYEAYVDGFIANNKQQFCHFEPCEWGVFFKRVKE